MPSAYAPATSLAAATASAARHRSDGAHGSAAPKPGTMRDGRELVGLGMATAIYHVARYPTSASVTLFVDGTATVRCATTDMGPGTYTSATQVAADALGLPMQRVRFELGDSRFPPAEEHGSSNTMASVGSAVQAACAELRSKLADLGSGTNDYEGLLRKAGLQHVDAEVSAAPGDEAKASSSVGFGAVFADVRVDPELCTIRVARVIDAYDAGRIVNPRLACSQCISGMVGGIGMALLEEAEWDANLGRVANATMAEYLVPVCADIRELDALFVESEDRIMNPLGVKGVAELGLCGVAPAIANAVWHATGKRMRKLPITPTVC